EIQLKLKNRHGIQRTLTQILEVLNLLLDGVMIPHPTWLSIPLHNGSITTFQGLQRTVVWF
ncbi:hypothetical protein, partial [Acinetobacter guillouiae]|uniref:hypothetical protein n=1 Tax=Acinetobacter guillouiae TaxID=106649 RepID=UPI0028D06B1D